MSGFFGIFNRNGKPVEEKTVNTMLDAMSYWGPDERYTWVDGSVSFGHAMLWNTPESKYEQLPLIQDGYVLTMDARIDNRGELLEKLDLPDKSASEIGDSEFILAAYKKWGEECPKHLLGDFSFAIWDEKKQQLFCARDHVGIKPLYYCMSDDLFVFSNDIRILLSHQKVLQQLNDKSVAMYLLDSSLYHKRDTFYKSITKLPAARTLIVVNDDLTETLYWDIEKCPAIEYNSFDEYVSKLHDLFINAVEVRLRSDYAMSSHLSGGLDSSSIAVLAARKLHLSKKPLYVWNWVRAPFQDEDPNDPEWGFSATISDKENIIHKYISLTPEYIADQYETLDIIKGDNSYWEENLLREYVKEKKSRTILSGLGGDELISYGGYSYAVRKLAKGGFLEVFKTIYLETKLNKRSWKYFLRRCLRTIAYPLLNKYMNGIYKVEKSNGGALAKSKFFDYVKNFSATVFKFKFGPHQEQLELYSRGFMLERLESWSMSAMHDKIEYRYPLLDKRIVEFALGIPESLYNPYPSSRRLFRNAIRDLLPSEVLDTGKYTSPKNFTTRKQLWLDALNIWMERNKPFHITDDEQKYIDTVKLYAKIKKMVSDDRIDFENIKDIEAVHPSLMIYTCFNKKT